MCGIAGFLVGTRDQPAEQLEAGVVRMAAELGHRGPDGAGSWVDASEGVALGHRRLAVIDLSEAGHQPMLSASGRWVLVFNGEIYNFRELREELAGTGVGFRGHSDTEVLLEACDQWGPERMLERANGMFAFALWDRRERRLLLARDRLGEKPLYYGIQGRSLLFGSELKALRRHPELGGEVDRRALMLMLRHQYVPTPWCIYRGLAKLPPGTLLTIGPDWRERGLPEPRPYWSLRQVAERGLARPLRASPEEAVEQLDTLLRDAVRLRLESDVPLGAFLSGGIDSSIVVALMQAQLERPVRTFSIGFDDDAYDEARWARRVAERFGSDHTELYLTGQDALAVVPRLPEMWDEPFADQSQIPTHLVSRLARGHVTVSLSGDGGDELFGGYVRYAYANRAWSGFKLMPRPLQRLLAGVLRTLPPGFWDGAVALLERLPGGPRMSRPSDKVARLAAMLPVSDPRRFYLELVSHWKRPGELVQGVDEPATLLSGAEPPLAGAGFVEQMMYQDTASYLCDDILVKLDRASMAVSLEARVPLLDPRVVEFAWSLPLGLRVRRGEGKWILKQLLRRYLPDELIDRPKMGFSVPLAAWLEGPLRDWAEALLDEGRLRREGYLDPAPVRAAWQRQLAGQDEHHRLWNVLMFQSWLESTRA